MSFMSIEWSYNHASKIITSANGHKITMTGDGEHIHELAEILNSYPRTETTRSRFAVLRAWKHLEKTRDTGAPPTIPAMVARHTGLSLDYVIKCTDWLTENGHLIDANQGKCRAGTRRNIQIPKSDQK